MKKGIIAFLAIILLVGCNNQNKVVSEQETRYDTLKNQMLAQSEFKTSSPFFTLEGKMEANGKTASIKLTQLKIEMYNVQALVMDDSIVETDGIWPQFNILQFVDNPNFIPNQTYPDKGIYAGFNMAFDTTSSQVKVLVKWQNSTLTETFEAYLTVNINK